MSSTGRLNSIYIYIYIYIYMYIKFLICISRFRIMKICTCCNEVLLSLINDTADQIFIVILFVPFLKFFFAFFIKCTMAHFVDNLGQFLRCVREGITGLSSEYKPNRVDNLLCRLTEFESTLGLISSCVGERDSNNQLLEDLEQLLTSVRFLKTRYQARHIESVAPPDMEAAHL